MKRKLRSRLPRQLGSVIKWLAHVLACATIPTMAGGPCLVGVQVWYAVFERAIFRSQTTSAIGRAEQLSCYFFVMTIAIGTVVAVMARPSTGRLLLKVLGVILLGSSVVWVYAAHAEGGSPLERRWPYALPIYVLPMITTIVLLATKSRTENTNRPNQCARCGYSLEGLSSCKCPECGMDADNPGTPKAGF